MEFTNEKTQDVAAEEVTTGFTNDLAAEDKAKIKAAVAEKIEALCEKAVLSINDLSHLAQVSHGSIKGRAKTTGSAREIVNAILEGKRAARTPSVNENSVKSFLASLSEEEKAKLLAEISG